MNINWVNVIVSVMSGIAVLIPLAAKLVEYVRKATQEKNWASMLHLVMSLMAEAEKNFQEGILKKEWVLSELGAVADTLNYEIDWDVVSEMIDALCDMARKVN